MHHHHGVDDEHTQKVLRKLGADGDGKNGDGGSAAGTSNKDGKNVSNYDSEK